MIGQLGERNVGCEGLGRAGTGNGDTLALNKKNKSCGSFILIDPITNNTSAVGMIIDRVEVKDMSNTDDIPVLDLPKLGIAPEHYEAVEKAAKELERQGFAVKIIK